MDEEQQQQAPMAMCTPRVTPDMLGEWEGKIVRMCGKYEGGMLESTNGAKISVVDSTVDGSVPYVEIVGEVMNGTTMRESRHHTLGEEFDLDVYGQFCKISTGSMRHMFVRN